jgi:hypothetical protein
VLTSAVKSSQGIDELHRWSAVARGAVIKVLKGSFDPEEQDPVVAAYIQSLPSIDKRISRYSYGIKLGDPIDNTEPPYDPELDSSYVDPEGATRVKRMYWYLTKVCSILMNPGLRTCTFRMVILIC